MIRRLPQIDDALTDADHLVDVRVHQGADHVVLDPGHLGVQNARTPGLRIQHRL